MTLTTPVLIVGAGPTGLTAAFCLKQLGIDCLLIDKKAGPTTTSNAAGVQARTLELWKTFGILDEAFRLGNKITDVYAFSGEKRLFDINFAHIDSPYQCILLLPQSQTEALMRKAFEALGGCILQSHTLSRVTQSEAGINAELLDANGETLAIHADYLIGADGYHSTVRDCAKIPFETIEYDGHFILMDVPILKPDSLNNQINLAFHEHGLFATFPMKGCARVIIEFGHDPQFKALQTPSLETVKAITAERFHTPITYGDPTWQSVFYVHEGLADQYRQGRIFLAGDAAHVHSPAGGQGMNLGIQDAHCLANKLAAVMKNEATPATLDQYQSERRPIAAKVVKLSSRMLEAANLSNPALIAIRNAVLPFLTANQWLNNQIATTLAMIHH